MTPLEKSIQHWQENLVLTSPDTRHLSPNNCALCVQYRDKEEEDCGECPIFQFTGQINCHGTPYETVFEIMLDWKIDPAKEADYQKAAKAELDFLISLK